MDSETTLPNYTYNDCDLELLLNTDNAPDFSLNGHSCIARVVNVHDGDTITVLLKCLDKVYKFHVRLNDMDAYEITSKDPLIKELAIKGRQRIIHLIQPNNSQHRELSSRKEIKEYFTTNKTIVYLECFKNDKYGRLLANVFTFHDMIDIGKVLITEGLACEYHGKTKTLQQ
jgi:endonuclease YncB( thermonuclease family)